MLDLSAKLFMRRNEVILQILFFTIVMSFASCSDEKDITGTAWRKNYIMEYCDPASVTLTQSKMSEREIMIFFDKKIIKSDMAEYDTYSRLFNDTDFNREYVPVAPALVLPIHGINIVCDEDYDAGHPKGASLNDIAVFYGISYSDYIASHYRGDPFETVKIDIDDITLDHTRLLANQSMMLYLVTGPTKPGVYNFIIEFDFGDKVVKGKVTMTLNGGGLE